MKKYGSCILLLLFAVSCGSNNMATRRLQTLSLNPAIANPAVGATVQFTASGTFNVPPSPDSVVPSQWFESRSDGNPSSAGVVSVDQAGLARCLGSGTSFVSAIAPTGPDMPGTSAMVRGTAQVNCP
jgi:hypothetical protein